MTKKKDPSQFKKNLPKALPVAQAPIPTPCRITSALVNPTCPVTRPSVVGLLAPRVFPKMVLVNVSVQEPVRDFLQGLAKERGCSASNIIREAIAAYLKAIE